MAPADPTTPDAHLSAFLHSLSDASYRERVGPLGLLQLLEPTRHALTDYEGDLVAAARAEGAKWEQIGEALGVPRQTAHRRWNRVG